MVPRKLLLVSVLLVSAVASAQPTIQYKSRELQEGRNYIQKLTGSLSVGESSGVMSYRFPIELPKAHGVTPELALEYSSQAGPSEYGWGWQLTLPTIERSDENGAPVSSKVMANGTFRYRNGQQTAELVYKGTYGGWNEYHERDEKTFSRYLQSGNVWQILRPDGTIIDLGTTSSSTQGTDTTSVDGTSQWLITKVTDANGNYARYAYRIRGLIDTISYAGNNTTGLAPVFTVKFTWTGPLDNRGQALGYRSGFLRAFGVYRLAEITVTAPAHATGTSPALIPSGSPTTRNYLFEYQSAGGFGDMFHLTSARVENEPPAYFTYQGPPTDTSIDFQNGYTYTGATDTAFPTALGFTDTVPVHGGLFHGGADHSSSKTSLILADVNSDGRPDLVMALTTGSYLVWKNTGGFFSAHETWSPPSTNTGVPFPEAGSLKTVDSYAGLEADTMQDFFDLNGDGYPDLVYVVNGSPSIKMAYCPGTGSGFGTCGFYDGTYLPIATGGPYLRRDEIPFANISSTDIDLIDMNGDGRPDEVEAQPGSSGLANIIIRFNTGTGFAPTTTIVTRAACSFPGFPGCLRLAQSDSVTSGTRLLFAETRDINGDGLPDFLNVDPNTGLVWGAYNIGAFGAGGTHGAGFTALTQLTNSSTYQWANGPGSIGAGYLNAQGIGVPAEYTAISDLIDMNGDGLVDIVDYDCKQYPGQVTVKYNKGGIWDLTPKTYTLSSDSTGNYASPCLNTVRSIDYYDDVVTTQWDETQSYVTAALMDINGDGLPDFLSSYTGPATDYPQILVRQQKYQASRKLTQVTTLSGNQVTTVAYGPQITDAPYPIHVPLTVTRSRTPLYATEPVQNWRSTTSYTYLTGAFDRSYRQFTGFRSVIATGDSYAKTVTTNYLNTIQTTGRVLSQTSANNLAAGAAMMTTNYYSVVAQPAGAWWIRLDRTDVMPGLARDLITEYLSYDAYGEPTSWVERGDTGSADDVTHNRTYVVRDLGTASSSILHLVSTETGSSTQNGPLSTTRYYYDGLSLGASPTKGNLTKLEREKSAGIYVAASKTYDSYGNVATATDEMGMAVTFGYDSTYHLYQTSATSPVGTVYTSYNALTGHEADKCGPQYSGSSWNCHRVEVDAIGRVTNIYVPTMSAGVYSKTLLTTYAYTDFSYPLQTYSIDRGVRRTFQFRDGFGNATEIRAEETSGTFRVYETAFDPFGNPIRVELARRETGTAYAHAPISTEAWTYVTDFVNGAIERVTHPRDPGDTSPPASSTRIVFSDHVAELDEDAHETDYYLDGFQRVAYTSQRGGALGDPKTVFSYSDRGEVTAITDPNGLVTSYSRNLLGWVEKVITPNGTTGYTYNDRHQVATTSTALGVVVTATYDTAARVKSIVSSNEPVGVRHVNAVYNYYPSTATTQIGMLQSESNTSGVAGDDIVQSYTYTPEGEVASHAVTGTGVSGTVSLSYAIGGRLDAVTYPDGFQVHYEPYLDDQVSKVTGGAGVNGVNLATYLYEDDGQPSSRTNQFGFDESYSYDARGRLLTIASTNTIAALPGDLVDDRIQLTKASYAAKLTRYGLAPGLTNRSSPDIYTINNDNLGRLDSVDLNSAPYADYTYDLGGRLQGINEQGGAIGSSTYNSDELTSRVTGANTQSWKYNAAGSVTHDDLYVSGVLSRSRDYSWDAIGRFAKSTGSNGSTEYFYTPGGDISHVIGPGEASSTEDVINLGSYARYSRSTGSWTDRVSASGEVIVEVKGSRFEMPHRTFNGTIAAVSNDLGVVIRQEEFRPYGSRSLGSASGTFEEHFQGLRADKLTVAGGRAYDPDAAVWLSRDSYVVASPELVVSTPQLGAMYSFEFGNPYRWRDANGHDPKANDAPHGFWGVLGARLDIDMTTGRMTAHQSDFGEVGAKVGVAVVTGAAAWAMRGYIVKAAIGLGVFKAVELETCRPQSTPFENQFPADPVGAPIQQFSVEQVKSPNFSRELNYVVTENGELRLGRISDQVGGGHIDLAHGQPVQAAGEVKIVDGKVRFIDNSSGHYLPSGPGAEQAAEKAFQRAGFDTSGKYIEKMWNGKKWVPK